MKVLLLNGPPRSGKDTIGQMLAARVPGAEVFKFRSRLDEMTAGLFGVDLPDNLDAVKDDPDQGPAPGVSWRRALIAVSESLVKPLLGEDYFGRALADVIDLAALRGAPLAIVTDSGFRGEAAVLERDGIELYRVGVSRDGCSFAGDSRSYWDGSGVIEPEREVGICNNGSLEDLEKQVDKLVEWLEV